MLKNIDFLRFFNNLDENIRKKWLKSTLINEKQKKN